MIASLLAVLGAYVLGAVPFGYLVFRARRGDDIRNHGSGNIGATNVARTLGPIAGLVTLLLDAGKGALAVAALKLLGVTLVWQCAGAVAALVGHAFPLFLGFRGGKSVAVGLGVFAVLAPRAVLPAVATFILVLLLSRYVSVASVSAALSLPLWIHLLHYPTEVMLSGVVGGALIAAKHHQNWLRLAAGTENRLRFGRAPEG